MMVSHTLFMWLCSILVGGLALAWTVYDLILLRRYLPQGIEARDKIFGSLTGITIGVIALVGAIVLIAQGFSEPTHCLPECSGVYFSGAPP